jgi:hypothetical protein
MKKKNYLNFYQYFKESSQSEIDFLSRIQTKYAIIFVERDIQEDTAEIWGSAYLRPKPGFKLPEKYLVKPLEKEGYYVSPSGQVDFKANFVKEGDQWVFKDVEQMGKLEYGNALQWTPVNPAAINERPLFGANSRVTSYKEYMNEQGFKLFISFSFKDTFEKLNKVMQEYGNKILSTKYINVFKYKSEDQTEGGNYEAYGPDQ